MDSIRKGEAREDAISGFERKGDNCYKNIFFPRSVEAQPSSQKALLFFNTKRLSEKIYAHEKKCQ